MTAAMLTTAQLAFVHESDLDGVERRETARALRVSTRTLARYCGPRRRWTLADDVLAELRDIRERWPDAWAPVSELAHHVERDPRAVRRALRELGDRVERRRRRHPVGNHVRTVTEWRAAAKSGTE
jgi:hypothetical protein